VRLNAAVKYQEKTHEGATAARITPEQQLRRSVAACMLWEDSFYENGQDITARISALVPKCRPEYAAAVAYEARTKMKLRHAPLLVVREMARHAGHKALVGKLLADVIQRPDEITEFLAIYWKAKKQPLAKQVKRGLAKAFLKFNEYSLAKYNRDGAVKLRDALFLCHAKPDTKEREELWKRLVDGNLATPDTWEVALSGGQDKKEAFTRLMAEGKLGALAFLRNLRNMQEAGVSKATVSAYASSMQVDRVLPFRFITAARVVPPWEDVLEPLMMKCLAEQPKLPGRTILMMDVSGSMNYRLSAKAETTRMDAGFGLGVLLREVCEQVEIFTFSNALMHCAPRRGFALRDEMKNSQPHSGTYLSQAVAKVNQIQDYDRIIVITDEQSADGVGTPKGLGYVINVATYRNGVGYGKWTHIDGWSEAVIDYIRESESIG
jgi:60 kDa SS-A/Ro ribonucleoprotein